MASVHSRLAVLCLLIAAQACAPVSEQVDSGTSELAGLSAKNLVFVHVDTLRSDHTPWYGSARNTMPRLAERGWLVVDDYVATSSWTASSTASVLTGAQLDQHGVLWSVMADTDPGAGDVNQMLALPTLASTLGDAGYATALFSGNSFVGERSGLDLGFGEVSASQDIAGVSNASTLTDDAIAWLDGQSAEQPFFLMLQPLDPHMPYSPEDEDYGTWSDMADPLVSRTLNDHEQEDLYRELISDPATRDQAHTEIVNLYDEQLLGLDRALDRLLTALEDSGRMDDTLVVFASDHGESLGDLAYDDFGHGKNYRPKVLHVPLMFHTPGASTERMSCLSSGTDLAPTLLTALGVAGLDDQDGAPMQSGCRESVYSSFYLPQGMLFASATDGDTMLVARCGDGGLNAYDLAADPNGGTEVSTKDLPLLMDTLSSGVLASSSMSEVNGCRTFLE